MAKQRAVEESLERDKRAIFESGGNPYEILRRREQQKRLQTDLKIRAEKQRQRELDIQSRLKQGALRFLSCLSSNASFHHLFFSVCLM